MSSSKADYLKKYAGRSGGSSRADRGSRLNIYDDEEDAPGWRQPSGEDDDLLQDLAAGDGPALVGVSKAELRAMLSAPQAAVGPRGRLDSSDDEEEGVKRPSQSAVGPRGRLDSSDDEEEGVKRPSQSAVGPRGRLDSSDDEEEGVKRPSQSAVGPRGRLDSSDDEEEDDWRGAKRVKMSSGHQAGLSLAHEFRAEARTLQNQSSLGSSHELMKGNEGTVYRDKSGRVIDAVEAAATDEANARADREKRDRELLQVRTGTAQIAQARERSERLEALQSKPVSRRADDEDLERQLRSELREGDPMAAFMSASETDSRTKTGKPRYRGPPAPPNRFGIAPGYRWDGVDRSSGFEERWLTAHAQRQRQQAAIRAQSMGGLRG
jgi:hypothetical protein